MYDLYPGQTRPQGTVMLDHTKHFLEPARFNLLARPRRKGCSRSRTHVQMTILMRKIAFGIDSLREEDSKDEMDGRVEKPPARRRAVETRSRTS